MKRVLRSSLLALALSACNGDSAIQPDSATLDSGIASLKISFSAGVDPLALRAQVPTVVTATALDLAGRTVESGAVAWTISQHPEIEYNDPYVRVIDQRKATLYARSGCDLLTASIRLRSSAGPVEATASVCGF